MLWTDTEVDGDIMFGTGAGGDVIFVTGTEREMTSS